MSCGVGKGRNAGRPYYDWRRFDAPPLRSHGRKQRTKDTPLSDVDILQAKVGKWARRFAALPRDEQQAVIIAFANILAASAKDREQK